MSALKPAATAVLSTGGRLTLPSAVLESRGWGPGAELEIEERGDAVYLREKPTPAVERTRMEDVYGMVRRPDVSVTAEDMRDAAAAGAAERYRRSFDPDGE